MLFISSHSSWPSLWKETDPTSAVSQLKSQALPFSCDKCPTARPGPAPLLFVAYSNMLCSPYAGFCVTIASVRRPTSTLGFILPARPLALWLLVPSEPLSSLVAPVATLQSQVVL